MGWWKRLWNRRPAVEPMPDSEVERVLLRRAPFFLELPSGDRPALRSLIQSFLVEKEFWGSRGLDVTAEMKIVVAAYACLLVLKRPDLGLHPRTREVILYPRHFGEFIEAIGPDGRRYDIDRTRIGETWRGGPVLLSWSSVRGPFAQPHDGHNTVLHEFAHALDYLDGFADGVPPLSSRDQLARWKSVFGEEYQALVNAVRMGRRTFLDPYGAESPAEFFAVATEHFFEQPRRFRRNHRRLYALLESFYRQDPASWMTS